uniref:phage tail tip fiber protein n=1 Tax=Moraxella canis TaxID=90239 RepID=UPI000666AC6C
AKFDSLEVGGRNLVIKSGDLGAWSNFVRSSMSQTDSTQYKTPVLRVLCTDDSWYAQKSAQSTHHIKQGESYVLSFFVKSNSSLNNTFVYGDNNIRQRLITSSTVLDETWQYIKVAFVASQDTQNIGVIIGGHGIANQSYVEFAEVKLERGTIATDWTPAPEDLQADIDSKASLASLDEFKQAQADKDGATAQSLQSLHTTVNGHTASIQQHAQSLNGLSAQWTLKVQSGGIVSGIGLASENGVSDFAVLADKFYVASPQGNKTPMFSAVTRTTTINGVRVPPGNYLSDAFIQNGSITNAHIANGSIDNVKIANGAIDNVKIANGAIETVHIGNAQVDTLQIKGEAVVMPRYQHNGSNQTWYDTNVDIETNRITINAQGGSVLLSVGFSALFALPKGVYNWGSFDEADSDDLHIFIKNYRWVNHHAENCVAMVIKKNGATIYEYNFMGNYKNSEKTNGIVLYRNFNMPILLDQAGHGDQTYTVSFRLKATGRERVYGDSDRTSRPQMHINGLSFQAMCTKR